MLLVAASFRLWRVYGPAPVRHRPSIRETLSKASVARTISLLQTPLAKWHESDRKREPEMAAWLEAQSQTVLPWEWSIEAMVKDSSGYCQSWDRVLASFEASFGEELDAAAAAGRLLTDAFQDEDRLYAHATNRVADLERLFATNALPGEVKTETLAKGRWWGWNRSESVAIVTNESQRTALLARQNEAASEHRKNLDELTDRVVASDLLLSRLSERCAALAAGRSKVLTLATVDDSARAEVDEELKREIVACLHFKRGSAE